MEISEQVYKGGTPSKTPNRAYANYDGHISKCKGWGAAFRTNLQKGRAIKSNKYYSGRPSNGMTGDKTCQLHGPGHSKEECKVLRGYSEKYSAQWPHNKYHARGKDNFEKI